MIVLTNRFIACVWALLAWSPLAAQETGMVFIESPTLLATFVQTPVEYDPDEHRTVVVGLHGFGSLAERFIGVAPPFTSAGIIFAAVKAPYAFTYEDGRIGYDWSLRHLRRREPGDRAAELSLDYIRNVLEALRTRYRAERLYLMGFSQGGAFAYRSAVTNSELIDGLIVFGSRFDESWFSDGSLAEASTVPVFIAHGDTDESTSLSVAEGAGETLRALGYDVTFRPFAGGHSVPLEIVAEVVEWIETR